MTGFSAHSFQIPSSLLRGSRAFPPSKQPGPGPSIFGESWALPPGVPWVPSHPWHDATLFSLSGADPEETILNAFKVFDPEGKGVLKAD